MSTFIPELSPYVSNGKEIPGAFVVENLPTRKDRRSKVLQTARIDAKRAGATLTERGSLVVLTTTEHALKIVKRDNPVKGRGRKPRENGIAAALQATKKKD